MIWCLPWLIACWLAIMAWRIHWFQWWMSSSVPIHRLSSWPCHPDISIKGFHVTEKLNAFFFLWVTPRWRFGYTFVDRFRIKNLNGLEHWPPQIVQWAAWIKQCVWAARTQREESFSVDRRNSPWICSQSQGLDQETSMGSHRKEECLWGKEVPINYFAILFFLEGENLKLASIKLTHDLLP